MVGGVGGEGAALNEVRSCSAGLRKRDSAGLMRGLGVASAGLLPVVLVMVSEVFVNHSLWVVAAFVGCLGCLGHLSAVVVGLLVFLKITKYCDSMLNCRTVGISGGGKGRGGVDLLFLPLEGEFSLVYFQPVGFILLLVRGVDDSSPLSSSTLPTPTAVSSFFTTLLVAVVSGSSLLLLSTTLLSPKAVEGWRNCFLRSGSLSLSLSGSGRYVRCLLAL